MAATSTTTAHKPTTRRLSMGETRADQVRRIFGIVLSVAIIYLMVSAIQHDWKLFLNISIIGLTLGVVYGLIALGYTLVYGILELINFAHGDLFMLAAVLGYQLTQRFDPPGSSTPSAWGYLLLSMAAAMIMCAAINFLIELVAYRRLRHAPKLAPLITAIGMSFVLQNVGLRWLGPKQAGVESVLPSSNARLFTFGDGAVVFEWKQAIVFLITIPLLFLLNYIISYTKPGKAMRAVSQDMEAAATMGIDVNRTISFTFVLAGLLAGAAGIVYAHFATSVRFDIGFQLGLVAFTAAVLGGIGNPSGAVLGAILIGLIFNWSQGLEFELLGIGQNVNLKPWPQSIVFTVLILILVFRPQGLLGSNVQEKV